MACFFIVDTYIDKNKGRGSYDDYIDQVKPIIESYGGEYLAPLVDHRFIGIELWAEASW